MLFFAIVYVVEGIGQARVGIIFQPLNYYLKDIGWTPVQVTAYLAILNFPWIIKPVFGLVSDFIPLFGYRREELSDHLEHLCGRRLCLDRPAERAQRVRVAARPHLIRDGHGKHLCGALLAENGQTFRPQQHVRRPAMAVVLHRHHGEFVCRRRAGSSV